MTILELALFAVLGPLASFALLAVAWPLRHSGRPAGVISAAFALASLVSACLALHGFIDGGETAQVHEWPWLVSDGQVFATLGAQLDGISLSMLVVVTFVAACVQVYSLGYMAEESGPAQGRYFTWHSLFIPAMGGLVIAPNLLQLFMGWELVGLCSYLLIGHYWRKPHAGYASVKAFWVTKFADMGLMMGIILLFATTGAFGWDVDLPAGGVALAVPALLLVGVMGKSAQVPLHIWLPDAMAGPTPVSALLHAATMVAAGVFLIVRAYPLFLGAPELLTFMTWLGAITAVMAACTAVVQDDIKKVLAYSTCSQLGYMIAALGSGALMGGYFHLTTHAFFKALLFLGAGAAIHAVHSNSIHDMGGLLKKMPVTGGLFIAASAALAGLPLFSGYFSKDLLLEDLLHAGAHVPLGLLICAAGLTAFYMTRVVCVAFLGQPSEKAEHAHSAPVVMAVPMLALGVLAVVGGFADTTLAGLWGVEYERHLVTPVGAVTTGVGLTGIGLGWICFGSGGLAGLRAGVAPVGRFILSGPVDMFWDTAWRRGLAPFARAIAWFDRYIIDGLINITGWATLRAADGLRVLHTGRGPDYVFAVVVGAVLFAIYGALGL